MAKELFNPEQHSLECDLEEINREIKDLLETSTHPIFMTERQRIDFCNLHESLVLDKEIIEVRLEEIKE